MKLQDQIQVRRSKTPNASFTVERNEMLVRFFHQLGLQVILIGDSNNPAMVYQHKILAAYIHNFRLHFLNKSDHGQDMYICRIDEKPNLNELTNWYKTAAHNKAWRIQVKGTPLFICGTGSDGHPVFGKAKIHYYMSEEFALHIKQKFGLHYCEVI